MNPYANNYYQQGYNTTTPYQPLDRLAQLQQQQYQPQYQQMPQMQMQQQPQQQINQGLLWVQGEAGAKSYLVAPNTTVLLMDSEASRFYLKSTDGAGMPSLRIFEYQEVSANMQQVNINNFDNKYVTREEYATLQKQYEDILSRLNDMTTGGTVNA